MRGFGRRQQEKHQLMPGNTALTNCKQKDLKRSMLSWEHWGTHSENSRFEMCSLSRQEALSPSLSILLNVDLGSGLQQRFTHHILSRCFLRQHSDFPWSMSTQALTNPDPIQSLRPDRFIVKGGLRGSSSKFNFKWVTWRAIAGWARRKERHSFWKSWCICDSEGYVSSVFPLHHLLQVLRKHCLCFCTASV